LIGGMISLFHPGIAKMKGGGEGAKRFESN